MKKSSKELDEHSPSEDVNARGAAGGTTRREFITHAVVATSAVAIATSLPSVLTHAQTGAPVELQKIGELVSKDKLLKGVIRITNGTKNIPGWTTRPMLRYFEGYDPRSNAAVWPTNKSGCYPGPTLRVGIGERVELTLINKVDVGAFAGSLDQAESGMTDGCDRATNAATSTAMPEPDKKWYPETRGDTFPNCFHGSSTANLHFHGTHVTPDGFGDNVLVSVRPNPLLTDEEAAEAVKDVFAKCAELGDRPQWSQVPESYTKWQEAAVKNYDLNAIWQGTRGPVIDPATGLKVPALPFKNQLTPVNEHNLSMNPPLWPQYFVGVYPTCFKVTEAAGHEMGQAPGTHWYHAHKHGSTAINLYNGLAGALIIEGDYDAKLDAAVKGLKDTEKVLVSQQFTDQPDLERPVARGKATVTNGALVQANAVTTVLQTAPVITMRPGEIQLWRIVNAQVQPNITAAFKEPTGIPNVVLPTFRQTAQDGVQFSQENYRDQPLTKPTGPAGSMQNGTTFTLAAGGRVDILVQAPPLPAGKDSVTFQFTGLVNLKVEGTPVQQEYPTFDQFPVLPPFLGNIGACTIKRDVKFGWEPYRVKTGPAASQKTHGVQDLTLDPPIKLIDLPKEGVVVNPETTIDIKTNMAPYFTIDDEQFQEGKFYQTMVLGDQEEWTIWNDTSLSHPFHIHVNPFQVLEVFDPNVSPSPVKYANPVWQDVINVPAALKTKPNTPAKPTDNAVILGSNNKALTPGYVKIRSRFVDFTGSFVLHCHILAHEDRGMMQLVRVIDGRTPLAHH
jgi:FtsP/CotA-like multicopper oxidase with cupredoxin domain